MSKDWPLNKKLSFINVGSGIEISIYDLAQK